MAPTTILLKGRGIRKEAVATAIFTPGDLLNIDSAGELLKHGDASKRNAPLFAVEDDINGTGIDDDYADTQYAQAEYMFPGCEVYAWVAASAAAIVIGALLESDGAGGLRILQDYTDAELDEVSVSAMAQAIEAVDNSGGGSRARIKVVII